MKAKHTTTVANISATQIQAQFVTVARKDRNDDYEYLYSDDRTQRTFQIRRSMRADDVAQFLLCEMSPNGRLVDVNEKGLAINGWDEPKLRILESTVGPNGVIAGCIALGIDPEKIVFVGAGYSTNTVFQYSLEACAEAIAISLNDNTRYIAHRELSSEENASLQHQAAVMSAQYWKTQNVLAKAAMEQGTGLFKGCYNMLGVSLPDKTRTQILAYLNVPTQVEWNVIRGTFIAGHTILWQAWVAVDALAPRWGDEGFPDAETLRCAIRHAVDVNIVRIEAEMEEHGSPDLQLCAG